MLVFIASRLGDLINAFIGLWLVPQYVPKEELGAVLPLTQVAGVFGLPVGILVYTYMKFLNAYYVRSEHGKVKTLIRTFIILFIVTAFGGTLVSVLIIPHFFMRIRIVSGSLGIIILATAILGAISPVFTTPLQALKRFDAYTFINFMTAPIRLMVMLVSMPFRALAGYMLGQASVPAFQIVASAIALRREMRPTVTAVPFWRDDGRKMINYSLQVTGWIGVGTIAGTVQTMIIRQRLPEVESAAYYMISRFSELGTYFGMSISVLLFPFVAEAHAKGKDAFRLLVNTSLATLFFGLLVAVGLAIFGRWLLGLIPAWQPYVSYTREMVLLSLALSFSFVSSNFYTYEAANNRFSFLAFWIPFLFLQMALQVCLTGYTFFDGILPCAFVEWMGELNVASLPNFVGLMLITSVVGLIYPVFRIGREMVMRKNYETKGRCL